MPDSIAGVRIVGVVGAGTMGAGIAQIALEAGHEVVLHDVDEEAIERGRDRIRDGLRRRAAKRGLVGEGETAWIVEALGRLRDAHVVDEVADEADLVVEAALEDLGLKQAIFRALDAAAAPDAILATNTSALSVAAIAAATRHPERVIGLHFFNPAPVMALVEVAVPDGVAPGVVERAEAIVRRWGKIAVRSADVPGFIVNRVNRPFTLEPLRLLEEGTAGIGAIDAALRGAGFPLGPFAYLDLVGLDVNLAATRAIWEGLGRPERLRPVAIQETLVADGALGRKVGLGFYRYEKGRLVEPAAAFAETTDRSTIDGAAIVRRVRLALADEARRAVGEGVASAGDIDRAVRLGANHPSGPLEWADDVNRRAGR
ncbi:MAG TPA: 3-hydroxyacyl-CoA dehydrogenase NAD-binding domain-containing protein [Candidatus Limnocylindrales bacterium]|nr:3-hydroxyacyl-CoA dehydrogenase NAD-binding domain-containing protein [Candidatus Limnocylindrales bacterium]